jgi:hypothetical protein
VDYNHAADHASSPPSTSVTVIHPDTGESIATNTSNAERRRWRNNMKEPGQWPGSSWHMSEPITATCLDSTHSGPKATVFEFDPRTRTIVFEKGLLTGFLMNGNAR